MLLLDGKNLAAKRRADLAEQLKNELQPGQRRPGLEVVLVGEDPASTTYVRSKERAAERAGIAGKIHRMPAHSSEAELLTLIDRLNDDDRVDGILVQLPLPSHLNSTLILDRIDATKDVDGFHPINAGLLSQQRPRFVPCTPLGITVMLDHYGIDVRGKSALVIGRSNIVGRPIAELLLQRDATVTIAHSRSQNIDELLAQTDVVVTAVGRPDTVRAEQLKPGCVCIDVGINRVDGALCGDLRWAGIEGVAAAATPVPGGVGPMTIAMLLENTVQAWRLRRGSAG
jgi:methylenetetrahydrofolate dehydrogenase (NADP+) / methenyltetrahydrofolate cyclohydrolase